MELLTAHQRARNVSLNIRNKASAWTFSPTPFLTASKAGGGASNCVGETCGL